MQPKYATMATWTALTNMSRSTAYNLLGARKLRAIKVGSRTLIDVEAGLAWLASQPIADISTGRAAQAHQMAEAA